MKINILYLLVGNLCAMCGQYVGTKHAENGVRRKEGKKVRKKEGRKGGRQEGKKARIVCFDTFCKSAFSVPVCRISLFDFYNIFRYA